MFYHRHVPWILTCGLLFIGTPAWPTQVNHGTLRRASEIATLAFAGTVEGASTERIDGHVVTHFHFSRLKVAKGSHLGNRLTLHMAGGVYQGRRSWTLGQPEFRIGRRYVVMLEKDFGSIENLYMPIIGIYQGFFPIDTDPATGHEVVHDWDGRPIVAISGGHFVSVHRSRVRPKDATHKAWNASSGEEEPSSETLFMDEDPGTRISESSFLEVIQEFATSPAPR